MRTRSKAKKDKEEEEKKKREKEQLERLIQQQTQKKEIEQNTSNMRKKRVIAVQDQQQDFPEQVEDIQLEYNPFNHMDEDEENPFIGIDENSGEKQDDNEQQGQNENQDQNEQEDQQVKQDIKNAKSPFINIKKKDEERYKEAEQQIFNQQQQNEDDLFQQYAQQQQNQQDEQQQQENLFQLQPQEIQEQNQEEKKLQEKVQNIIRQNQEEKEVAEDFLHLRKKWMGKEIRDKEVKKQINEKRYGKTQKQLIDLLGRQIEDNKQNVVLNEEQEDIALILLNWMNGRSQYIKRRVVRQNEQPVQMIEVNRQQERGGLTREYIMRELNNLIEILQNEDPEDRYVMFMKEYLDELIQMREDYKQQQGRKDERQRERVVDLEQNLQQEKIEQQIQDYEQIQKEMQSEEEMKQKNLELQKIIQQYEYNYEKYKIREQKWYIACDYFTEIQKQEILDEAQQMNIRICFYKTRIRQVSNQVQRDQIQEFPDLFYEQMIWYFFPNNQAEFQFENSLFLLQQSILDMVNEFRNEIPGNQMVKIMDENQVERIIKDKYSDVILKFKNVIEIILKPIQFGYQNTGEQIQKFIQSCGEKYGYLNWQSMKKLDENKQDLRNKFETFQNQFIEYFGQYEKTLWRDEDHPLTEYFLKGFVSEYMKNINILQQYFQILQINQGQFYDYFTQFQALKVQDQSDYLIRQKQRFVQRIFFNIFDYCPIGEYDNLPEGVEKSQQYTSVWAQAVQSLPMYQLAFIIFFLRIIVSNEKFILIKDFLFARRDDFLDIYLYQDQGQVKKKNLEDNVQSEIFNKNKNDVDDDEEEEEEKKKDDEVDFGFIYTNQSEQFFNCLPVFTILQAVAKIKPENLTIDQFSIVTKAQNITQMLQEQQQQFDQNYVKENEIQNFYTVSRMRFLNLYQESYTRQDGILTPVIEVEQMVDDGEILFYESLYFSHILIQYLNDNTEKFEFQVFNEGIGKGNEKINQKFENLFKSIPKLKIQTEKKRPQQRQIILTIQVHCLIQAINEVQQRRRNNDREMNGFNVNQGINIVFDMGRLSAYKNNDEQNFLIYFNIIYIFFKLLVLMKQVLIGDMNADKIFVDPVNRLDDYYSQNEIQRLLNILLRQDEEERKVEIQEKILKGVVIKQASFFSQFTIYFKPREFFADMYIQNENQDEFTDQRKKFRREQIIDFFKSVGVKNKRFIDEQTGKNEFERRVIEDKFLPNYNISAGFSGGLGDGFFTDEQQIDENERRKSNLTSFLGAYIGRVQIYHMNKFITSAREKEKQNLFRISQIFEQTRTALFFNSINIKQNQFINENQEVRFNPVNLREQQLVNILPGEVKDLKNLRLTTEVKKKQIAPGAEGVREEQYNELVDSFKRFSYLDNRYFTFTKDIEGLGKFSFNDLEAWGEDLKQRVDLTSRILYDILKNHLNCQQILFIYLAIKILSPMYAGGQMIYSAQDLEKFLNGENMKMRENNNGEIQEQYFEQQNFIYITEKEKKNIFDRVMSDVKDLKTGEGINFKQKIEKFSSFVNLIYRQNVISSYEMVVECVFVLNEIEANIVQKKTYETSIAIISDVMFEQIYIIGWNGHIDVIYGKEDFDDTVEYLISGLTYQQFKQIDNNQEYIFDGTKQQDFERRVKSMEQLKQKDWERVVIIEYDFETTIGTQIDQYKNTKMKPYLVVFSVRYQVDKNDKNNQIMNNKIEMVMQNFLKTIERTDGIQKHQSVLGNNVKFTSFSIQVTQNGRVRTSEDLIDVFLDVIQLLFNMMRLYKYKIYVIAHNAAKFDTILLSSFIMSKWTNFQLLGTLTNQKCISVNQTIYFQCSLMMTQLGSLDSACGPKGLNLNIKKKESGQMKFIRTLDEYKQLNDEERKVIIEYCIFDVFMLNQMLIAFNKEMIKMFNDLFNHLFHDVNLKNIELIDTKKELFILKMSLPSTVFTFFSKFFYTPGQNLVGLDMGNENIEPNEEQYFTFDAEKRGGYTEIHNNKFINAERGEDGKFKQKVHSVDVCSMYPYQMKSLKFGHSYEKKYYYMDTELIMKAWEKGIIHQVINELNQYYVSYYQLGDGIDKIGSPILIDDRYDITGCSVPNSGLCSPIEFGDPKFKLDNELQLRQLIKFGYIKSNFQNFYTIMQGRTIIFLLQQGKKYDKNRKTIIKANFFLQVRPQNKDIPYNPFKDFVEYLYAKRLEDKENGKQASQQCKKLSLNSTYGKVMQIPVTQFYLDATAFYYDGDEKDRKKWKQAAMEYVTRQIILIKQQFNIDKNRNAFQNKQFNINYGQILNIHDSYINITELETRYKKFFVIQVQSFHMTPPANHPSRYMHLGVQITAAAREYLAAGNSFIEHSAMENGKKTFQVLQNDTDSIYFRDLKSRGVDEVINILNGKDIYSYKFGKEVIQKKFELGNQLGQWTLNDGHEKNENGNPVGAASFAGFAKKFYAIYTPQQCENMEKGIIDGGLKSKGVSGQEELKQIKLVLYKQIQQQKSAGDGFKINQNIWKRTGLGIQRQSIEKLIRTDGMFETDKDGNRIPFNSLQDKREKIKQMKQKQNIQTYFI